MVYEYVANYLVITWCAVPQKENLVWRLCSARRARPALQPSRELPMRYKELLDRIKTLEVEDLQSEEYQSPDRQFEYNDTDREEEEGSTNEDI